MANQFMHATSLEVATINGTKTILELSAAANVRVRIAGWGVSFKGTSATDAPFLVQVFRASNTTNMVAATLGANLVKKDSSNAETLNTLAFLNNGGEPGFTSILESFEVHPQTGIRMFYPMGDEIIVPGGGFIAWRVTTTLVYNCTVEVDCEE